MPIGKLRQLMDGRLLATHFQPIRDAMTQTILGYEALVRLPAEASWQSPLDLFGEAELENCAIELDLLLVELALTRFRASKSGAKLFVNVMPSTLFATRELTATIRSLVDSGISPTEIVLEITEHGPPREPAAILRAAEPLRELGCEIAIDDLGAGTSGLKIWSELRPEYVKIDRYFIDRIETDAVAAEMLRSLLDIAHVMGSRVIAEAVERPSQCELLRALGVDYLQGYLLGRPEPEPARDERVPVAGFAEISHPSINCAEGLLIPRSSVAPDVRVEEVLGHFQEHRDWDCIVVVDDGRPLGIVRRDKLLTLLSKPLYPEIYNRKPVSKVMEANPIVVDARARLDQVSRLVTGSGQSRVNEDFIIARHGGRPPASRSTAVRAQR